jgi:hypothetical protein
MCEQLIVNLCDSFEMDYEQLNGNVRTFELSFTDHQMELDTNGLSYHFDPSTYSMLNPHVLIFCFSLVDRMSLECATSMVHVFDQLYKSHTFKRNVPLPAVLFVGMKKDLRRLKPLLPTPLSSNNNNNNTSNNTSSSSSFRIFASASMESDNEDIHLIRKRARRTKNVTREQQQELVEMLEHSTNEQPLTSTVMMKRNRRKAVVLLRDVIPSFLVNDDSILLCIMSFLSEYQLEVCASVCKRWYKICTSDTLWHKFYQRLFEHTPPNNMNDTYREQLKTILIDRTVQSYEAGNVLRQLNYVMEIREYVECSIFDRKSTQLVLNKLLQIIVRAEEHEILMASMTKSILQRL